MEFDFSGVEEGSSLVTIPEGVYVCRVDEVRERKNRDGTETWGIKLVVAEGHYSGRTAAWDNLVWDEFGASKIKMILRILGFDVSGKVNLEPKDLEGRLIKVKVKAQPYKDPVTGNTILRNRVLPNGYFDGDLNKDEETRDVPF